MARRRNRQERLETRQAEMRARQDHRNSPAPTIRKAVPSTASVLQRHYKFRELEEMTGISHTTLRGWFAEEKQLIRWGHAESLHQRRYFNTRIPESTAVRVLSKYIPAFEL